MGLPVGWLLPLVIVACGALAYCNSFQGAFVFDDKANILDNPAVHEFRWGSLLEGGGARRLGIATFALNYAIGQQDPLGYHVVNLAIHLAAALVLYALARRLLELSTSEALRESAQFIAFVIALLWVVHPLQTQAVTYIVQRYESLMGLCYFACLYCVLRGSASAHPWRWYALSLVAMVLGIGGKESMITAPVAVLLMDRLVISRSWSQLWQQRKWLYALYAAPLVVVCPVLLLVAFGENKTNVGFQMEEVSALEYLRTQPSVISYYLWLAIFPLRQCFDYLWPVANSWPQIVLPTALLVAIVAIALANYRRRPLLTFAILVFFLHLSPTSSFVPIRDLAVEHRMYVPLAAVLSIVVVAGYLLVRRLENPLALKFAAVGVMGIVLGLTVLSLQRNQLYHRPIDLWSDVMAKAPHNYRGYNNYANALVQEKRYDEALAALEQSLKVNPRSGTTLAGLANVLAIQGEYDRATTYARKVVEINPDWQNAHSNLAYVLSMQDRHEEAAEAYRAALELNDGDAVSHANLGIVLMQLGRREEAVRHFDRALEINPNLKEVQQARAAAMKPQTSGTKVAAQPPSVQQRAQAMLRERKHDAAIELLSEAVASESNDAQLHFLLGSAHDAKGDLPAAVKAYERAIELDPSLARAHNNLGSIVSSKDPQRAIEHFRAALETDPRYVEALGNLGNAFARTNRFGDAIACYQKALEIQPDFLPARRNLQVVRQLMSQAPATTP